ncbi:MAG: aromatic amino acid lyase, partial [Cyanobacteria bacterium]|nr:aromatic amino acid lyase [Cyanobacteriota bacterium]
ALRPQVKVALADSAKQNIIASRNVIESVIAQGKTVYGVNTGFGALSHILIPPESVQQLQSNLVRSHAAGTGEPLEPSVVRAMMLLRANTLAKGFSGIRLEIIEALLALLNAGVIPVIPSKGSLGASGDLAPLAHLALVLMGEGEAWILKTPQDAADQTKLKSESFESKSDVASKMLGPKISGADALAYVGIPPIQLEAKEGLALLNGTQMMSAIGVLTLLEAERLLVLGELAGAMTIEAVKGSHQPFDERIAQVRNHPGHLRSAQILNRLLANSEIAESHRDCQKVQDPYSLRCIPQVHGAVWDAISYARQVLSVEINSATDNPLVFPNGEIISQGNFHGEPVAMVLDFLGI